MGARQIALLAGLAVFGAMPVRAAEPVIVQGPGGAVPVSAEDIAALPVVQLNIGFATDHGPRQAAFEGPLLWTVLDHTHAVDAAKHREDVRQIVLLTGGDGYTAVLALGEISPEFENKQVIVAERMDGNPLDHPRIVVPGDKRGGRGVHELVRIAVMPIPGG